MRVNGIKVFRGLILVLAKQELLNKNLLSQHYPELNTPVILDQQVLTKWGKLRWDN